MRCARDEQLRRRGLRRTSGDRTRRPFAIPFPIGRSELTATYHERITWNPATDRFSIGLIRPRVFNYRYVDGIVIQPDLRFVFRWIFSLLISLQLIKTTTHEWHEYKFVFGPTVMREYLIRKFIITFRDPKKE